MQWQIIISRKRWRSSAPARGSSVVLLLRWRGCFLRLPKVTPELVLVLVLVLLVPVVVVLVVPALGLP